MSDILIVGGGIIGLLTARELLKQDVSITLVEMGETGRESSWAGGGIVSPLYPWRYADSATALVSWSQQQYPHLCEELREQTGIDIEYTRSGLLILDTQEQQQAEAWKKAHAKKLELVDQSRLEEFEPALGPDVRRNAFWLSDIGQIRTPRLTHAARLDLGDKIQIIEHAEVQKLLVENDRVKGVSVRDETLRADTVIICAGAWTGKLLAQIGQVPDIQPIKGQIILFYGKPGQINHIILHEGHYVIPRRDGRVLTGSTIEHAGFAKTTTAEAREELYRKAVEILPLLKHTPIENHWAGLRPGSPKGIPYIGAYPGVEGLYVNAGHFRNGVVMAPSSAHLLADIVLGRTPIVDPSPYALNMARG